ncbi:MAG TPA: sigma 54-interacting transcriptional regulator [Gemmatimonadales bacterium]|nr:sigma 54-interacting transcriptional regulator [Gemmatimonadales bacterium]
MDRSTLLDHFVAQSTAMVEVLRGVDRYARAHTPVVLAGATGTGKTTVAELIHTWSGRPGPLSPYTAGEFDRHLEQSQLFGHERGAFTGAVDRHCGALEQAADGTLLLDDFHHLRRSTQTLLLRVLDRGFFRRLGGSRDLPLRCRVLIGLVELPDRLVEQGALLRELRYRLGYSLIRLPLLAERREDIPQLAGQFIGRCPEATGEHGPDRFAPDVIALLQAATWPGNLRQLEMVVRDAYLRARGSDVVHLAHVVQQVHLPARFERRGSFAANAGAVRLALEVTQGNVGHAAQLLRTSRTTIYHYLAAQRCGIQAPPVSSWPHAGRERDTPSAAAG